MKKCVVCDKEFEDFTKNKNKLCCSKKCLNWRIWQKLKNNPETMIKRQKTSSLYKSLNKEKVKLYDQLKYSKNKEKILLHKKSKKDILNKQHKERYKTDIQFRLRNILRKRLKHALKNKQKSGSAVKDLGCTIEELKKHLETQFQPGMNWTNIGKWHVDHIKPLSSFDLTDLVQLRQACNFTNLQPLWAIDNLKKGCL